MITRRIAQHGSPPPLCPQIAATKLHADDTPVPVLAPPCNGKTKTSRLWTYGRDDRRMAPPAVWFAYSRDRKGIHPQTHLASFKCILQADAYVQLEM